MNTQAPLATNFVYHNPFLAGQYIHDLAFPRNIVYFQPKYVDFEYCGM